MARIDRDVRSAMRDLEDAVVELHAAEERAAGRAQREGDVGRARRLYLSARDAFAGVRARLPPSDYERGRALLETVGLLLAVREACGEASIAARFLS